MPIGAAARIRRVATMTACLALSIGPGALAAQRTTTKTPLLVGETRQVSQGQTFDGSARQLDIPLPRLSDPRIRIDGLLDEPAWDEAAVLTGFTQYEPNEGVPAIEPTEVRVFYAPDAIYFGIHAFDSEPDAISAIVGQRDRGIFGSDWIRLMLDTYNDQRQAYLFYVNPLGIQADGLWIEGQQRERGGPPVDFNPDFIWESRGQVVDDGWVAEIKIPYQSIQFREGDGQTWRLNIAREVRRYGYKQSWAPLTQNQSSQLAQSGRLSGIGNISAPRLFEINPVMTGAIDGARIDDGSFSRGSVEPQFGLDGRYGITRNLTLGATLNPDFSQIEADADQITVNERFAIFFPEKRPFFLDGTEIFSGPTRLVHTRRIVDPIGGAKLTGKVGGLSLAYLGAVDESPVTFDPEATEAFFHLARLRADIGAGSSIGALYTDRSAGAGISNRVASADARLLIGGRLAFTTQFARSWSQSGVDDPRDAGSLWFASLQQAGRRFGFQAIVEGVSPDFRADAGFIRRIGDIRTKTTVSANFFTPPGSALESIGIQGTWEGFFDYGNFFDDISRSPFEHEVQVTTTLSFRGGRSVSLIGRNAYFRFRPETYASYEIQGADGSPELFDLPGPLTSLWAGGLFTRSRISEALQIGGRFFFREIPIFAEARRGFEIQGGPDLTLRPNDVWQIRLSYTMSRIRRVGFEGDGFYSSADIPRLRTQYQFSRSIFARVVLQYDFTKRVALLDPTTGLPLLVSGVPVEPVDRGRFLSQVLFSYEPAPRTVFFIGWSRQMEGDRRLSLTGMEPIVEGFFVKMSYLLRL